LKKQQRKKSQAWLPQAARLRIEKERRLATDKGKKAMPVNFMTAVLLRVASVSVFRAWGRCHAL